MRKLLVGILVLSMLLLAGCVEVEFHLVINRDGSGDFSYSIAMDKSILDMMKADGDDPLAEAAEDARADGYTVTTFTEDDKSGIRATRHLNSITASDLDVLDEASAAGPGLVLDKSGSKTKYMFEYNFDMSMGGEDLDLDDFGDFGDMFSYVFKITSPYKPDTHNADSVSSDGKTMTWNLKPGQQNQIRFTATESGASGILTYIIIGAAALLLLVLVLVIVIKLKNRKRYYEPINTDLPE